MGDIGIACQGPAFDPSHMPQQVLYVIPGSWYWQTVALESGLLLLDRCSAARSPLSGWIGAAILT